MLPAMWRGIWGGSTPSAQAGAELGRAERVYQLARNYFALPGEGHLEVAVPADRPFVREWVESFIEEVSFEMENRTVDGVVEALIGPRLLYLWKSPQPVSMAAWVAPTPHGAAINFVYTPPEFRGQGYGKAVSDALGSQMLASGLRSCFILTNVHDERHQFPLPVDRRPHALRVHALLDLSGGGGGAGSHGPEFRAGGRAVRSRPQTTVGP